ncbi:MAG: hypothetical protein ACM3U2_08135 [Deltaproteobacteria bacterium]
MSIRTRMFVVAAVAFLSPACTRHILQMSSPEQASTVTLFDGGEEGAAEDDTVVVLNEPAQISRVARYFRKRAGKWEPYTGRIDQSRRYQISFRKGDDVTDRFWIVKGSLFLHSPTGKYYKCDLSDAERSELLNLFSDSRPAANAAQTASEGDDSRSPDAQAKRLRGDEGA